MVNRTAPVIVHNSFEPGWTPGERGATGAAHRERRIERALAQATGYLLRSDRHGVGDPRTLFDARTDGLELADVRAALRDHLGERAAFHRLTLTLHPSLEVVTEPDVQRWTRAVLTAGSTFVGAQRPAWCAATHRDTGVLHVHAILAGRDASGRELVLRPLCFAQMRASGRQEAARLRDERTARARRLAAYSLGATDTERTVAR